MSTWQERFESHPLRVHLSELQGQLPTFEISDQAWAEQWIPHLEYLMRRLASLLELSDPELVTQTMLDTADSSVVTIQQLLVALPTAPDPAASQSQVQTATDSLTQFLNTWPAPPLKTGLAEKELSSLRGEIQRTRKELDKVRESATEQATAIQSELANAQQEAQNQEVARKASQDAAVADLTTSLAQLSSTVESQKARLDQAITDFQAQFSAAQEARVTAAEEARTTQQSQFEASQATQLAAFEDALNKASSRATAKLEEQSQAGKDVLAQLETLRQQAERTTNAIGMAAMAGGYKLDADQQKKNADWLRWLAIIGLSLSAVAVLIALLTSHSGGQLDYKAFFAKLVVSVATGSIAAYAIVQSAHHRERERQDRKLQIELASIDSYLALMPEDTKVAIKSKLAEAWFGKPIEPLPDKSDAEGGPVISAAQLIKFIQSLSK